MNIDETYQKILTELEQGHRALQRFSPDELEEIDTRLLDSIKKSDFETMEKLLCLVEHTAGLFGKFEQALLLALNSPMPDNLIIFTLNCARKHIIEARFQKGQRLEFSFLEAIKTHLFSKNPEVVEWTLRLIEGCGNQGIYFLKEFDKIKPGPLKWFNSHQRAVREIITLLERRWSPSEKSRT